VQLIFIWILTSNFYLSTIWIYFRCYWLKRNKEERVQWGVLKYSVYLVVKELCLSELILLKRELRVNWFIYGCIDSYQYFLLITHIDILYLSPSTSSIKKNNNNKVMLQIGLYQILRHALTFLFPQNSWRGNHYNQY